MTKLRKVGEEELQRLFFWQHLQTFKPKLSVYYHNKQYDKRRKEKVLHFRNFI